MSKVTIVLVVVLACFGLVPVAFAAVIGAPVIATTPVLCEITGPITSLTASQSGVVEAIAGRAELAGLGDNGVRVGVQASLAMTGLENLPNDGDGVGIFAFDPNGNWGPEGALVYTDEDAELFMSVLEENPTWVDEAPATAASDVLTAYGVVKTATPSVFAAFATEAAKITSSVVSMETAASCGDAGPGTVSNVGGGGLPSGYTPTATSTQRQQAVAAAVSQLGNRYVWGGASPSGGFDCSGLVMWAWEQATPAVTLDHYTVSQWEETTDLPSLDGAEPGDLVLVPGVDGSLNPPNPQHVGMYIGDINGVPWVVDAADPQLGVIAQTYSSFISGGLIAVGHIPTSKEGQ